MRTNTSLFPVLAIAALTLAGCDKSEADRSPRQPGAAESENQVENLCTAYTSCDACIEGEQQQGKTEGEAETVCGLAVTGCWTTWDKPVSCGEDTYEERPN